MGKTSSAVKNRYNLKAYDRLAITIPKGRKQAVEAFARERGESVNGLVNALLRAEMGLSETEWRAVQTEEEARALTEATMKTGLDSDPLLPLPTEN